MIEELMLELLTTSGKTCYINPRHIAAMVGNVSTTRITLAGGNVINVQKTAGELAKMIKRMTA